MIEVLYLNALPSDREIIVDWSDFPISIQEEEQVQKTICDKTYPRRSTPHADPEDLHSRVVFTFALQALQALTKKKTNEQNLDYFSEKRFVHCMWMFQDWPRDKLKISCFSKVMDWLHSLLTVTKQIQMNQCEMSQKYWECKQVIFSSIKVIHSLTSREAPLAQICTDSEKCHVHSYFSANSSCPIPVGEGENGWFCRRHLNKSKEHISNTCWWKDVWWDTVSEFSASNFRQKFEWIKALFLLPSKNHYQG